MDISYLKNAEEFEAFTEFMHNQGFKKIPRKKEELEKFIENQSIEYLAGLKLTLDHSTIQKNLFYRKTYDMVYKKLGIVKSKREDMYNFFYDMCLVK